MTYDYKVTATGRSRHEGHDVSLTSEVTVRADGIAGAVHIATEFLLPEVEWTVRSVAVAHTYYP